jgi:putative SOS response-associated peptidase YedK
MVNASVKSLGIRFGARIQKDAFEELFENRNRGSGVKIPKTMEAEFLGSADARDRTIQQSILEWRRIRQIEIEEELLKQEARLQATEQKLAVKETKTALNDQRIAKEKIEKCHSRLAELVSEEYSEHERIYPMSYAPLLVLEKGELVIRPFRYHLRPAGQPAEFDRKFDGTYNIRHDRLAQVAWWKNLYGRNHGVLLLSSFFENVRKNDFERRPLHAGEQEKNLVVEFSPQRPVDLLVPCLFDRNEEGTFALDSFGLITDEPNPEVLAAGHDRTPIFLKESNLRKWLDTRDQPLSVFEAILNDKEPTRFEVQVDR